MNFKELCQKYKDLFISKKQKNPSLFFDYVQENSHKLLYKQDWSKHSTVLDGRSMGDFYAEILLKYAEENNKHLNITCESFNGEELCFPQESVGGRRIETSRKEWTLNKELGYDLKSYPIPYRKNERIEEKIGMQLLLLSEKGADFKNLGKLIDREIKVEQSSIDLISRNNDSLYLIELKKANSAAEGLFKVILQIETYYSVLGFYNNDERANKFMKEFNVSSKENIKKAILIFKNDSSVTQRTAYTEFKEMFDGSNKNQYMKAFIDYFDIEVYILNSKEEIEKKLENEPLETREIEYNIVESYTKKDGYCKY